MKRQTALCRRGHCGHVGTIHAVNTRRGRQEYGRCLVRGCRCTRYQAPAPRALLDRFLDAVADALSVLLDAGWRWRR